MAMPDTQDGSGAARLAILVARSAVVPRKDSPQIRGYTIDSSPDVLTAAQAAARLASLPKPVLYAARLDRDIIRVELVSAEQSPRFPRHYHRGWALEAGSFSPLEFLSERYGEEGLAERAVICHGAGDFTGVTVGDVRQWAREYSYDGPHGFGADFADSEYPAVQGVVHPDLTQAAGFMTFGWGDDASSIRTATDTVR